MRPRFIFLLALTVMVSGCASGAANAPPPPSPAGASSEAYPLRPGDIVRLRIWREPDLSGDFMVDQTATVVLPKVGPVKVSGRTAVELERDIRTGLERYLRNPSIEIVLLRRISILGEVRAPGLYPLDPTMTLADAVALAGGILPTGRQDHVEILRGQQRFETGVTEQTRIQDLGIRSGDQLYIPQRAWLNRNAGIIASLASTILGLTVSLIIAFNN